jgi:hypothetical protein
MRELFKIIKDNFILLLGTGLFTYSLFSFKYYYHIGKVSSYLPPVPNHYYYEPTILILLTVGAIFIVVGLIKLRTRKDKI